VEQGLPVIRATSTGVSAVIDAYGRPLQTLGIGEAGVIDAKLPEALQSTLYARFGDAVFWLLTILGLTTGISRRRL
jgi:apolipoprotein N-acyltransferase